MERYNDSQVIDTVKTVMGVLEENKIEYRLMGSLISAALYGGIHRKINDLDLLVDKNKQSVFEDALQKRGFSKKVKNHLRVSEWLNLSIYQHSQLLETSFYGITFKEDGSGELRTRSFMANVSDSVIERTVYDLAGIRFVGIPAGVVYRTILFNKSNPKRRKEI
jgi:hypothetical protein